MLTGCEPIKEANYVMGDIIYTKDLKTDLCFAVMYPKTNWMSVTNVPCDKVERLIK